MSQSVAEIRIQLPDGSTKTFDRPVTPGEVAASIGSGLARAALAAKVNGRVVDLDHPITEDTELEILTSKSPEALEVLRHSCTHLMAQAVKRLHPEAMLEDGPPTEEGFWYDIRTDPPLTPEDFPAIEKEMRSIAKEALPIERQELSREEAYRIFKERGEKYKLDLIERIPEDDTISTYRQGEFIDLCRGPHVPHTGVFKAFKLLSVAGAYWKGDAENEQLCRIKGTAFPTKQELDAYLQMLEEAKRRDHRRVGRELELFMHHEWAPGEIFWLPKGHLMYRQLSRMMSDLCRQEGYDEVFTPLLFKADLFKVSGHWEHYREDMFLFDDKDENQFALKPMNCPSHMLIFREKKRSYRELPMRIHDQGVLHRNEASGTLSGLTRVRQFCQDDAHIFLAQEQIEDEITALIGLVKRVYDLFDMQFSKVCLSTRPESYLGEKESWDQAEKALSNAIEKNQLDCTINEGDGAFYGPKIDFIVRDCLGREWQTATIQLDYQLPARFELKFINRNNEEEMPVVVHRAIFGSFERFFAILIEHYGGNFPVWLAPEQVRVLTISEKHEGYAQEVYEQLQSNGIRAEKDFSAEKIGAKIREGRMKRVPYLLVVGEKEASSRTLSVRSQQKGDLGSMPLGSFLEWINREKSAVF